MPRRFGRHLEDSEILENPERRIESEGDFSQVNTKEKPYVYDEDDFDKRLDAVSDTKLNAEIARKKESDTKERKTNPENKRIAFIESIEVQQPKMDTPLLLAYKELDEARKSGIRENIINAEDKILDLEIQEEEKEYTLRITELKQMQKTAKENNDAEGLKKFKEERKNFVTEMRRDELNYKIAKLQNAQRLKPSRENLKEIMEIRKELDLLEKENIDR